MAHLEYRTSLVHRLAGWIGAGYLHFVGRTSAVQKVDDPGSLEFRRDRKPLIYAFWHNHQAFLAWIHRGEPVRVMVSRSKDGEYIAQILNRLGVDPVRGSTSRGGESAFRQMCAAIERGQQGGFTPDGPRGPARKVHPGVIAAAQITGAPVIPIGSASRRKIVFRSWDRFFVPLPFSHIVVRHGKPLWISPEESVESASARVAVALDEAVETAERCEREAPSWWTSAAGGALGLAYAWLGAALAPLSLLVFLWKHGTGRTFRNLGERLNPGGIRSTKGRRLWLHAASVGEWQALKPILSDLRRTPDFTYILTVSSPEARAMVAVDEPDLPVRMMPLDLAVVVRRWIARVRPEAVIIAETELWPNMIARLHRCNVPVFIVNGRLSERSASRWRLLRPMAWRLMSSIAHFYVRTDLDGRRFCSIGASVRRVTVTGNTKVDNLAVLGADDRERRRRQLFGEAPGVVLLAGSTWPGEEEEIIKLAGTRGETRVRVAIAPRSRARFEDVAGLLSTVAASWSRWSEARGAGRWDTDILLVDTIGDLKDLYAACDVAFVGGSLVARGGQNPLEPAAAGVPVLFGPSMGNFHDEAAEMKKAGAARQARHAADLGSDVAELASNADLRASMGAAAAAFVQSRQGAARRTAEAVRAALLVENSRA